MKKIFLIVILGVFVFGGCTREGNRYGQGLVKDYIGASVVRNAQNRSDASYARQAEIEKERARKTIQLLTLNWMDFNKDRSPQKGEVGSNSSYFDLNKHGVYVAVSNTHGDFLYTVINNKIGYREQIVSEAIVLQTSLKLGEYLIIAEQGNLILSKKITLTKF
jgi:hypothetical protein